ncbi:MAG TPA: recombinase family protein [Streptosporangiaceae bacterium]|nr:recombinase family protein [Streptosporangiaceae bacterium]
MSERVRRAAVYVRISKDKRRGSLDEGLGVADQEQQCRELAARLGYLVVAVFCDNDISAYSGRPRPQYLKLLELLHSGGADVVLCWHTDRLHRSNAELEDYINVVEPREVTTETVKAGMIDLNTPIGRMVARQLCTIARYESEHRAERVAAARERQARLGRFGGGRRPYGFEADGVTVIESEAAVITGMANAVISGVSLRAIAHDLRKLGVPTAAGTQWTPPGVRDVLLRPRNAGLMVHRQSGRGGRKVYTDDDIVGTAPWDPILKEDVWKSVVARLTDPERRTNTGTGPAPKWLGSGIFLCPCGSPMRVNKSSDRRDRPIYRCQTGGRGHVSVAVAALDELVGQVVIERLSRPDAASLIATPARGVDVAGLRAELATHRARLEEIAADREEDRITRAQFLTQTARRRAKMEQVEARLAEVTDISPLAPLADAADVAAAWQGLPLGQRRAVIAALITVTIRPAGRGRRPEVADRVSFSPAGPAAIAA